MAEKIRHGDQRDTLLTLPEVKSQIEIASISGAILLLLDHVWKTLQHSEDFSSVQTMLEGLEAVINTLPQSIPIFEQDSENTPLDIRKRKMSRRLFEIQQRMLRQLQEQADVETQGDERLSLGTYTDQRTAILVAGAGRAI